MALHGKLIVFTGTLTTMKRAEAKAVAEANGAKVGSSVTGKTEIMVAASDAPDKKVADAKKKGVEIWTEAEFVAAAGGDSKPAPAKKRAAPAAKAPAKAKKAKVEPAVVTCCHWEFEDNDGEWQPFADVDAQMLQDELDKRGVKGAKAKFKTKDFSFNQAYGTNYEISFSKMTQTNTESGNARNMRRVEEEEELDEAEEEEVEEKPAPKKAKKAPAPKKAKVEAAPAEESVAASPAKASGVRRADRNVPGRDSYEVVDDYDCKLMQTNLGNANNNK